MPGRMQQRASRGTSRALLRGGRWTAHLLSPLAVLRVTAWHGVAITGGRTRAVRRVREMALHLSFPASFWISALH